MLSCLLRSNAPYVNPSLCGGILSKHSSVGCLNGEIKRCGVRFLKLTLKLNPTDRSGLPRNIDT